jgi:ABC-type bacteriocin/lantibiotic exporter with double-glycine peptidase domain
MSHHHLIIPDPEAGPIKRATVRRVVKTFGPYRTTVALVGGLILITSAIGVINPLLIKVVFDQALFCGPGCPNLELLYWLVGLMVAIPIGSGVIGIWQSYLSNVVGQRVMQDLRNALYAHLQRMPLRFFTTTRTGEIQSRLSNDVGGIQSVVTDTASSVLANVVIVISTVVAMLILSWQLTLLSSSGSRTGWGRPVERWPPIHRRAWPTCPPSRRRPCRSRGCCCPRRSGGSATRPTGSAGRTSGWPGSRSASR